MKLLTVNMTLDPVSGGGSAARALQATRALADLGVSCAIATSGDGLDGAVAAQLHGVTLVRMPTVGGRFRVPRGGYAALASAVARAEIVLLLNHWTVINALAGHHAFATGVPYVVCPAGALPIDGGRSRWLKRAYNAAVGRRIVSLADAHVAVTSDETAQFAAYGVDPRTVVVIPNGMPEVARGDGAAFRARSGLGDAPLLLFVGRLAPIKGPDLLLSAFAQVAPFRPDWHLVIAGPDDGMGETLRAQAAALGLGGRVRFAGFIAGQDKADALAAADLVVVPSRREAMSIVVLEAAAAARAVLVTDRCGVPEVANDGGGWVVAASVDGIAGGLLEATGDRQALAARGGAWQRAATRRYAWSAIAARYLDLFSDVLARRGRS